ncbi:DUF3857 domain-containing protein [Sphaerotilaceae bacterium SBD11-9]
MNHQPTPPRRGRAWQRLLMLACGWLAMGPAFATSADYAIAPAPSWVRPIAPSEPAEPPTEQLSQGVHYLLADSQTRVDAQDRLQYRHTASKAINQRGVESVAHVEIRFDPSYQTLTLHSIQVRRGNRIIPKLATASVKVLQREKELEYLIFDGSKTANVFLDDIRVGDIVEYAYSVRGSNPVFGNRQFGRIDLQWAAPVHQVYARLLWPQGRPLELLPRNQAVTPSVSEQGSHREYLWQARNVPALVLESNTPNWFDPYPSVQWGEFKDWQSVARWATPYYRVPQELSPALQAEVDRIARDHAAPQERLLAALQFVQREIRYLGVEIGPGSHAPSAPGKVLERRFGDCKDKSLLTITLLQALGIDARPALVNTGLRRGIRDLQPTPYAFNHVIVRASLKGKTYWIDPTRAPQKGDLAHLYQPDYDAALVVDESTRELASMANDSALYSRSIHTVFEAQGGFDKPVRYTVTTVAQGAGAEAMRNTLATENREDLQKRYLNFYANYYPKLVVDAPMDVKDDERDNRITLTEHYLITDFWKRVDARKRTEAAIHVPEVDDFLRRPRESIRIAPLGLAHPVSVTHTTEVRLPEDWGTRAETVRVEDASFEFERKKSETNKVLTVVDSYRSRADHVAPGDTERYAANLGRAREAIDMALFWNDNPAPAASRASGLDRMNWTVALLALLLLGGYTWLALKIYRYDPPAAPPAPFSSTLQGISGWLILPAIGAVIMPIRLLVDLSKLLPAYAADNWAQLTTVGTTSYHALWAPLLLYELATNLAYLVLSVLVLVMFFQKRRGLPKMYIAMLVYGVVARGLDMGLAQGIPAAAQVSAKEWSEMSRGVLAAAVWGSYFAVSKRVQATFVKGRKPTPPAFEPTRPLGQLEPTL